MFLNTYGSMLAILRIVLFWCAAVVAVVCVIDWAIRTRRVSPFSRVARFFRARIDPLMVPVERVVIRSGGRPASAPWWSLIAIVIGGLLLLYLLQAIGTMAAQLIVASESPSVLWRVVVAWGFALLRIALLVRVVSSWLPISRFSPWIRWSYVLTEWMLAPLRSVIPTIGMIDITPIVAYFILILLQRAVGV